MIIWFALLIPLAAIAVMYFMFHDKMVWWEAAIFLATIIVVVSMKYGTETCQTSDTEWCTDLVVQVEHHEKYVREWEEWVPEQGHTDSDGNYVVDVPGHYETRTEHHPEHWDKIKDGGKAYRVTQGEYNRILSAWGELGKPEVYTDLRHSDQRHGWTCPKGKRCNCSDGRGDMFHVQWPGSRKSIEPITWTSRYENRIQASHSVFRYPELPEDVIKTLYELPKPDDNYNTPVILGQGGPTQATAEQKV